MSRRGFGGGAPGATGPAGPMGNTVWTANSLIDSSAYPNGLHYLPVRHSQSESIDFQFVAGATATIQLSVLYAMSAASGSNVRWRLDVLKVADGDNPTSSVVTGSAFTKAPGNDVLIHTLTSSDGSDLALSVTAGQVVYCYLTRLGSDGADTHSGDARLIEVRAQ